MSGSKRAPNLEDNGGRMKEKYNIDFKSFWEENKLCFKPFCINKPRAPLLLPLSEIFVTSVIDVEDVSRFYRSFEYQQEVRQKTSKITIKHLRIEINSSRIMYGMI